MNVKLCWLTDIHLNFLDYVDRSVFYQKLCELKLDAILISGDIAEAVNVSNILKEMADDIQKPIYFVLGNHDYYGGQIKDVRSNIAALTKKSKLLYWLPATRLQRFNNKTILLGQDGWADARLGDYQNSRVVLNDSRMIVDLFKEKIISKFKLLDKMQSLADEDARALETDLDQAIELDPEKVIVLTHVPPFREVCMHEGKISNDEWLPYFSSKASGDVLEKAAKENPNIEFLVLCGHTHGKAHYQPYNNLTVRAGGAEYRKPEIQDIISI